MSSTCFLISSGYFNNKNGELDWVGVCVLTFLWLCVRAVLELASQSPPLILYLIIFSSYESNSSCKSLLLNTRGHFRTQNYRDIEKRKARER